jgi:hypothetical protein
MATTSESQKLTVLPRPTWLDATGMSKGIDHDRQHLGIILAAGQQIKARQTNTALIKLTSPLRILGLLHKVGPLQASTATPTLAQ